MSRHRQVSSVPNTWAQGKTLRLDRLTERVRLACVQCCADIRHGSWCNPCREIRTARARSQGWLPVRVQMETANGDRCDCGREKPLCVARCSRCSWLDRDAAQAVVVSALRSSRWSTISDVVESTRLAHRTVVAALTRLMSSARVTRVVEELDTDTREFRGGGSRYLYRLTD